LNKRHGVKSFGISLRERRITYVRAQLDDVTRGAICRSR